MEEKEFQALHKKVVNAYLRSDEFRAAHPRKWAEFQERLKDTPMPTKEELAEYAKETGRRMTANMAS